MKRIKLVLTPNLSGQTEKRAYASFFQTSGRTTTLFSFLLEEMVGDTRAEARTAHGR
jgi:hypothetical protein